MFDNSLVTYSGLASYINIIAILSLALVTFIRRTRQFQKRQRIFIASMLVIIVAYAMTMVIDSYFKEDNIYFVAFTVAQNVGFVAMLGGIYSFYILQLVEAREYDALTDPLTGLYNRRFLAHRAEWLHADKLLDNTKLCLIIIDIDHFKNINDTYGHQKGDEVIVRFAQVLRHTVRDADIVIRSGGDEFVVLLPDATLAVSIEIAERLTVAVEESAIPHPNGHFSVSATCGVAGPCEEFDRLFQAADSALYGAKSNGRNQVRAAPDMVPVVS